MAVRPPEVGQTTYDNGVLERLLDDAYKQGHAAGKRVWWEEMEAAMGKAEPLMLQPGMSVKMPDVLCERIRAATTTVMHLTQMQERGTKLEEPLARLLSGAQAFLLRQFWGDEACSLATAGR